jgi:hypothetical protein
MRLALLDFLGRRAHVLARASGAADGRAVPARDYRKTELP